MSSERAAGLEERLLENLGETQHRAKLLRPRSFARKVLLAAVVATLLTVSVGAAAVIAHWDRLFVERFGPEAETSALGQSAFQEVNVTSVCDDVTLTVRQAPADDKTVSLILDYQLPSVELEGAEQPTLPTICFCTGKTTWEDFSFSAQPLTLVVLPLKLTDGKALTDHPAVLSFQPIQNARTMTGEYQAEDSRFQSKVTVSTFTLSVESWYGCSNCETLREDTSLVFRDESVVPVTELSTGCEGSSAHSASFSTHFRELLDMSELRAVRIGTVEIPLNPQ